MLMIQIIRLNQCVKNNNSTMNKKFTNEFYLPIQQSIHNLNHKTKLSQTKTMNNKSH